MYRTLRSPHLTMDTGLSGRLQAVRPNKINPARVSRLKKLFVGNLPYQATDEQLRQWFASFDVPVEAISVIIDRFSGQPRGFGFIEVADDVDAARIVGTCNGREFLDRTLIVDETMPLPERPGAAPRQRLGSKSAKRPVRHDRI